MKMKTFLMLMLFYFTFIRYRFVFTRNYQATCIFRTGWSCSKCKKWQLFPEHLSSAGCISVMRVNIAPDSTLSMKVDYDIYLLRITFRVCFCWMQRQFLRCANPFSIHLYNIVLVWVLLWQNRNEICFYSGLFNWTMTFHSQSDVPVPYGRIVRRQGGGQTELTDYHSTKPLLAATLQSHCGGVSGRFDYLDQLVEHLQVDVWGACGSRYNQLFSCPHCNNFHRI